LLHALLLLPCLLSPSAAQDPGAVKPPQVARFALSREPQGFDPMLNAEMIDAMMQRQVLECLTEYDYLADDASVIGQLAESLEPSDDGLVWHIKLREDSYFHDPFDPPLWPDRKRPVVARDVLYSWLRLADARSNSKGFWAMDGILRGVDAFRAATAALDPEVADAAMADALENGIEGIRVLGRHELVLRLEQPDPLLPNRLAMSYFAVYPYEAVTRDGRSMRDQPVGSAPFVVDYWLPGQTLLLKRTPDWREEVSPFGDGALLPYLDEVSFHVVRETATRQEMFRAGEVDRLAVGRSARKLFLDERLQLLPRFEQRGIRLFDYALADTTMLCFGMEDPVVGDLPGDEEGNRKRRALRRALALAFPYDLWSSTIRGDLPAQQARGFLPPVVPGASSLPTSQWNRLDLEEAAAQLAAAGYPDGHGLPQLEFLLSGTDPVTRSVGDLYVASLARIGIRCRAVPMSYGEQLQRARDGDAQMFLRAWVLDWPDGALVLQLFHGPQANTGVNLSRFMDPAFDELFESYRALPEGAKRLELLRAMHEILERQLPAVAIDHRRARMLVQPWLDNFHVHLFNAFYCKYYRITEH
jgi:peptide/nickel transport system substrate-binding protein